MGGFLVPLGKKTQQRSSSQSLCHETALFSDLLFSASVQHSRRLISSSFCLPPLFRWTPSVQGRWGALTSPLFLFHMASPATATSKISNRVASGGNAALADIRLEERFVAAGNDSHLSRPHSRVTGIPTTLADALEVTAATPNLSRLDRGEEHSFADSQGHQDGDLPRVLASSSFARQRRPATTMAANTLAGGRHSSAHRPSMLQQLDQLEGRYLTGSPPPPGLSHLSTRPPPALPPDRSGSAQLPASRSTPPPPQPRLRRAGDHSLGTRSRHDDDDPVDDDEAALVGSSDVLRGSQDASRHGGDGVDSGTQGDLADLDVIAAAIPTYLSAAADMSRVLSCFANALNRLNGAARQRATDAAATSSQLQRQASHLDAAWTLAAEANAQASATKEVLQRHAVATNEIHEYFQSTVQRQEREIKSLRRQAMHNQAVLRLCVERDVTRANARMLTLRYWRKWHRYARKWKAFLFVRRGMRRARSVNVFAIWRAFGVKQRRLRKLFAGTSYLEQHNGRLRVKRIFLRWQGHIMAQRLRRKAIHALMFRGTLGSMKFAFQQWRDWLKKRGSLKRLMMHNARACGSIGAATNTYVQRRMFSKWMAWIRGRIHRRRQRRLITTVQRQVFQMLSRGTFGKWQKFAKQRVAKKVTLIGMARRNVLQRYVRHYFSAWQRFRWEQWVLRNISRHVHAQADVVESKINIGLRTAANTNETVRILIERMQAIDDRVLDLDRRKVALHQLRPSAFRFAETIGLQTSSRPPGFGDDHQQELLRHDDSEVGGAPMFTPAAAALLLSTSTSGAAAAAAPLRSSTTVPLTSNHDAVLRMLGATAGPVAGRSFAVVPGAGATAATSDRPSSRRAHFGQHPGNHATPTASYLGAGDGPTDRSGSSMLRSAADYQQHLPHYMAPQLPYEEGHPEDAAAHLRSAAGHAGHHPSRPLPSDADDGTSSMTSARSV